MTSSTSHISNTQREVQRILHHMTGLNVRPVPMPVQDGIASTSYLFKCQHSDTVLRAPPDNIAERKILEIHDFQGYIKKLVAIDTEAGLDEVIIDVVPDPDDPGNDIWPCVRVRFCTLTGAPHSDDRALAIINRLQTRLEEYAQQHAPKGSLAPVRVYQKKLCKENGFKDAYAKNS